ncbi:MAG: capsid protein [Cressdnaviricota sp.]|nr:MAG: capsid protein [Cressdnaviricota sp.]
MRRFRRRYPKRSRKVFNVRSAHRAISTFSFPTRVSRTVRIRMKTHHFKQVYFPSATSLVFQAGNSGNTYTASSGILTGPDNGGVGTTDGAWALMFRVTDLPQITSFAGLFDAYRINKVVVRFEPLVNMIQYGAGGAAGNAGQTEFLSTVIDKDDNSPLTAYSQLLEYESFKETPGYRRHIRSMVPSVAAVMFKTSGTTVGFGQRIKPWIDITNTDVEHYGLKGYTQKNGSANLQMVWKVFVTMYISFKQVR